MRHAAARLLIAAVIAMLGIGAASASPAFAAQTPVGPDLGWMRLQPAKGTIGDAIDGLTQAKCPAGKAIVVKLSGPGIPATREVGYLVGNTALTALAPTSSGQLWVPMSLTFRDWFGRNIPGFTPVGTYTLTTICRDAIKSALTYGHYSAQVTITKAGTYSAVGDAALPFNTVKGEKDPLAAATASPSGGANPSGSGAPTGGAPSASASSSAGATPGTGATPTTATDTSSLAGATTDSGSGVRLALLAFGALLVVASVLVALRARQVASDEPAPAGRHGSVDVH
jgi:hypothetical protein